MHTVKKSAVQYAKQWAESESGLVDGLASRNLETRQATLARAAGVFRVARNFRLSFDVGRGLPRLSPALTILDDFRTPALRDDSFLTAVNTVRRRFAVAYGRNDLLSAATKFLWLMHQHPVVIYDSRVRDALGAPDGDYALYLDLWNERYAHLAQEIQSATNTLADDPRVPAGAEWFRRRVLDIHLWNLGG